VDVVDVAKDVQKDKIHLQNKNKLPHVVVVQKNKDVVVVVKNVQLWLLPIIKKKVKLQPPLKVNHPLVVDVQRNKDVVVAQENKAVAARNKVVVVQKCKVNPHVVDVQKSKDLEVAQENKAVVDVQESKDVVVAQVNKGVAVKNV